MKKCIAMLLIWILCAALLCACAGIRYDENNISGKYDRAWIVGKTREEIVARYGDFDREYLSDTGENLGAYYVNEDTNWLDPSHIHDTYFVVFNGEDRAENAYFRETSIGG